MRRTIQKMVSVGLGVILLLVSGAVGAGTPVAPKNAEMTCGYCSDDFGGNAHEFPGFGNQKGCSSDIESPATCHGSDRTYSCNTAHHDCPQTHDDSEINVIAAAAASADVNGVHRLIALHGNSVRFNPARHSIQLMDCQGSVLANLPVSLPVDEALGREARIEAPIQFGIR